MSHWSIHWLEAERDLSPWREPILAAIEAASTAVSRLVPKPALDILIQSGDQVIPQLGTTGFAHSRSLLSLTIDPDNPNLAGCLSGTGFCQGVVHEVHHCMRMAGPGYGHTLGEALVTEGLAGRFVKEALGTPPEPWESAVSGDLLARHFPADDELWQSPYRHDEWFFGAGGKRPHWLGYTLGYDIVGRWLSGAGQIDGETWINIPARTVITAARSAAPLR